MSNELQEMRAGAAAAFPAGKMRDQALKAIQWRLRGPNGEFVGLKNLRCSFVPMGLELVFNGFDNEQLKLAMYEMTLGSLTIEVLEQSK